MRAKQTKNKTNKMYIKFDMEDRREYLTGFQKRKKERREKAHMQIKQELKQEMKNIKKERRDLMQKMMHNAFESDEEISKETVVPNVAVHTFDNVTVEVSGLNLLSPDHHLGFNQMTFASSDAGTASAANEETMTPEELEIHDRKSLCRTFKKTSMQFQRKSKLLQKKQRGEASKQRKSQNRMNKQKEKAKTKKMKRKIGNLEMQKLRGC